MQASATMRELVLALARQGFAVVREEAAEGTA
jgi:Holliday junction resolvase